MHRMVMHRSVVTPMMVMPPGMMILRHREPRHGKEYDRSQ
jgi:hypothetical protein